MRRTDEAFKSELFRRYGQYKKNRRNLRILAAAPGAVSLVLICALLIMPRLDLLQLFEPAGDQAHDMSPSEDPHGDNTPSTNVAKTTGAPDLEEPEPTWDVFTPDVNLDGVSPTDPFYPVLQALMKMHIRKDGIRVISPSSYFDQMDFTPSSQDELEAVIEALEALLKSPAQIPSIDVDALDAPLYTLSFSGNYNPSAVGGVVGSYLFYQIELKDGKYLRYNLENGGIWEDWYEIDSEQAKVLTDLLCPGIFDDNYIPKFEQNPFIYIYEFGIETVTITDKNGQTVTVTDDNWLNRLKNALLSLSYEGVSRKEVNEHPEQAAYSLTFVDWAGFTMTAEFSDSYCRVTNGHWFNGETDDMNNAAIEIVHEMFDQALQGHIESAPLESPLETMTPDRIEAAVSSYYENSRTITDKAEIESIVELLKKLVQGAENEPADIIDDPPGKYRYTIRLQNDAEGLDFTYEYVDPFIRIINGDRSGDWYKVDVTRADQLFPALGVQLDHSDKLFKSLYGGLVLLNQLDVYGIKVTSIDQIAAGDREELLDITEAENAKKLHAIVDALERLLGTEGEPVDDDYVSNLNTNWLVIELSGALIPQYPGWDVDDWVREYTFEIADGKYLRYSDPYEHKAQSGWYTIDTDALNTLLELVQPTTPPVTPPESSVDPIPDPTPFRPNIDISGIAPSLPFYEAFDALRNLSITPKDVIFAAPSLNAPQLSRTAADQDDAYAIIDALEAILKGKVTETDRNTVSKLDALTYTLSFTGTSTLQFQIKDGKYLRSSDPKWGTWDDWCEVDPALVKQLTDLFDPNVFEPDYAPTLTRSPLATVFDRNELRYVNVIKGDQRIFIYDTDWHARLQAALLALPYETLSYNDASKQTSGECYTLYIGEHCIELVGNHCRVDDGFWFVVDTVETNNAPMAILLEVLEDALCGETYHKTIRETAKALFNLEYDYDIYNIEAALYPGTANALQGIITDAATNATAVEQLDALLQTIEGAGIPDKDLPAGKTIYSLSPSLNVHDGDASMTLYIIQFREDGYLRYTGGDQLNRFNTDWYKVDASKAQALIALVKAYCTPLETLEAIVKPNGTSPESINTLTYLHGATIENNVFYGRNRIPNTDDTDEALVELIDLLCSIKLTRCDEVYDMGSGEEMLVYVDDRQVFSFKDDHINVANSGCYRISRTDADKLYDLLTDGQSLKATSDPFDRLSSDLFGVSIQTGGIEYDELSDQSIGALLDCLRTLTLVDADRYALSTYSTDQPDYLLSFSLSNSDDLALYLNGEYVKLYYDRSGASRWYKLSSADCDKLYAQIKSITDEKDNEGLEDALSLFDKIDISTVTIKDQSDGGREIYHSSNASGYTPIVDALKNLIALNGKKNYAPNPANKLMHESICYRITLTGTPKTYVEGNPTELTYGFELLERKYLCYSTGAYGSFDGYSVWYDVDESAAQALNALIEWHS